MKPSKFLFDATSRSLDILFKHAKAHIRVYGEKYIPNKPVLFVANHFTRIETIFLPYIIKKYTGKYSRILAHHNFFTSSYKIILEKLGAVSTRDPERDTILINALLSGTSPVLIFPEGQMLKDKKIIEKGKYVIYNAGLRRAPHTGASRLALRAEFYRQKIKQFYQNKNTACLNEFKSYFNLTENDLENIRTTETMIVPVNISYYPVRAKNNTINRLIELFVREVPSRLEEEIEVEGTMLLEGVDIDINFGVPIPVSEYLLSSKKIKKKIRDKNLYLDIREVRKQLPFFKESVKLMYRYMNSIYQMTTINQDHIFSYMLFMHPKKKINENDFKNRINLAINLIKQQNPDHFHVQIKKDCLHTDDFSEKYASFMKALISENLISLQQGRIVKNSDKLKSRYNFHFVRKENIVEVLKNELQPLTHITSIMDRIARLPSFLVKRKVYNYFMNLEQELFEKDYREFYREKESKPKNIGRPFFLKRPFQTKGVLLIHGYMSAPEEIRHLAEHLFKNGYAVYGVRLRGHGTSPDDLALRCWGEWYDSVNRAYIIMKNRVKHFAIAGFSTGAGLALLQVANKNEKFKGMISINAPLHLQNIKSHLAASVAAWNTLSKSIHLEKASLPFVRNNPENPHINYLRNPIHGVQELGRLMKTVNESLSQISIPSLIIQGTHDPIVNPESGRQIFAQISSPQKELVTIPTSRHGIVNGAESELVIEKILHFLEEIF